MVSMAAVFVLFFLAFAVGSYIFAVVTSNGIVVFKQRIEVNLQKQLAGLFIFNDAGKLSLFYVAALIVCPLLLLLSGCGLAVFVVSLIGLFFIPKAILWLLESRRAKAINSALPDALSQLASSMRAGATFTVALQGMVEEEIGPLGEEFSLLLREHRIGARMEDALDNLAERVRSEEMDLVVSAVLIAQDVGGNLAEILDGLANTIRRKLSMEGKVAALTSQGVMQGFVVSAMPFGLLLVLCIIEPESTLPIFQCLLGWIVLAMMAILQISGAVLIKKIVSIEI